MWDGIKVIININICHQQLHWKVELPYQTVSVSSTLKFQVFLYIQDSAICCLFIVYISVDIALCRYRLYPHSLLMAPIFYFSEVSGGT